MEFQHRFFPKIQFSSSRDLAQWRVGWSSERSPGPLVGVLYEVSVPVDSPHDEQIASSPERFALLRRVESALPRLQRRPPEVEESPTSCGDYLPEDRELNLLLLR